MVSAASLTIVLSSGSVLGLEAGTGVVAGDFVFVVGIFMYFLGLVLTPCQILKIGRELELNVHCVVRHCIE